MTEIKQTETPQTTTAMLYEFVRSRFLSIVFVLVALGALLGLVVYDGEIPRWQRLAGLTALAISPLGYFVGSQITNLLPDPPGVVLVDIDAREMDGAVYWFPVETFHDLTVAEGELNQVAPSLYFGQQVNPEELTAVGTWRGTMSDRELLRGLQKVHECRGQLEDDAKKGFVLETQAFTIIRTAVRDATHTIVETFQRGTLPDEGDGINHAIDSALEQFDLDKRIEDDLEDVDGLDDDLLDPDGDLEDTTDQPDGDRVDASQDSEVSTDD